MVHGKDIDYTEQDHDLHRISVTVTRESVELSHVFLIAASLTPTCRLQSLNNLNQLIFMFIPYTCTTWEINLRASFELH